MASQLRPAETHTKMKTDTIDGHGQSAVHNPSELVEVLRNLAFGIQDYIHDDEAELPDVSEALNLLSQIDEAGRPVTYFATDGSYGPCSGMILANTMPWSLDDWQDIEDASDHERVEVAEKIAAKYQ